ncbi:MAG: DUF2130 domain-containing protein [Bacteroidota bacterium]
MKNSNINGNENGNNIECPNCHHFFDASEILGHRIKENLEKDYQVKFNEIQKLKKQVLKQQSEIDTQIETGIDLKLKAQKLVLEKKIREHIESENSEQIKSYQEQLKAQIDKTKELLRLKAEYQKIQRENEILKEQYEADFQARFTKEISEAKTKIKTDIEKTAGFKIQEQQILISQLETQLTSAKTRIEQSSSSQQLTGEAAEILIENFLKEQFAAFGDEISAIGKGIRGCDSMLTVKSAMGEVAGQIVFESKRTKTWQKDWVEKFRDDMRRTGKDKLTFGILVTDVYPKGITKMTQVQDVWVCSHTEYQNLVLVLRQTILLIHETKNSQQNGQEKSKMLLQYISGPQFKNAVEGIIRSFTDMKSQLDKEKSLLQSYWKNREIQLDKILTNTAEMYHGLRGIIGSKVPNIKLLEGGEDNNLIS